MITRPIHLSPSSRAPRFGFTLPELLIVVAVLSALATLVVPRFTRMNSIAGDTITRHTMAEVRKSLNDAYYYDAEDSLPMPMPLDTSRLLHPQLHYLYVNPLAWNESAVSILQTTWTYDPHARRGWSGPYLDQGGHYEVNTDAGFTRAYGETGDRSPLDGWGNPIVLQQPVLTSGVPSAVNCQFARLVSAGPDGILQTPIDILYPLPAQQGDDLVLYLKNAVAP